MSALLTYLQDQQRLRRRDQAQHAALRAVGQQPKVALRAGEDMADALGLDAHDGLSDGGSAENALPFDGETVH